MTFSPDPTRPLELLQLCPAYKKTPLVKLDLAQTSGVWIKDETDRMGMGAFKAIGGIYAVARLLQEHWKKIKGLDLPAARLPDPEVREVASHLTFVCASAGNHGLAVAAGAKLFGARCRIHLCDAVPDRFEDRLVSLGADVVRSGAVYDESVAAALADAEESGAILLADGSWEGYTWPPSLVMEGYTVIAEELKTAFSQNGEWPTHVFLQAGVGGLAAAIACMIRASWTVQPHIIIVEPTAAPCLRDSHRAGKLVTVAGPASNMGRLDCKVPSLVSFDILEKSDVEYTVVTDEAAAAAAAELSDHGFDTTPSGAAGYAGLLSHLSESQSDSEIRPLVLLTEQSEPSEGAG